MLHKVGWFESRLIGVTSYALGKQEDMGTAENRDHAAIICSSALATTGMEPRGFAHIITVPI